MLLVATLRLENFYWCTSGQIWQGKIQNCKIEEWVWNTIHKAKGIPDSDVILIEHEGQKIVRVKSVFTMGKEHLGENYDKDTCVSARVVFPSKGTLVNTR